MKMLARAALVLFALFACVPAAAQRIPGHKVGENGIGSATGCSYADTDGTVVLCGADTPLPVASAMGSASTTPLTWSTTTSQTYGPWSPQLGRDIWASFAVSGGSFTAQISTTIDDNCADALPLTAANGSYALGSFSGAANEDIGPETRASAKWCVTITPSSGATVTGGLSQ